MKSGFPHTMGKGPMLSLLCLFPMGSPSPLNVMTQKNLAPCGPTRPRLCTASWLVEGITIFMYSILNQGMLGNSLSPPAFLFLVLILSSEALMVKLHCQLDWLAHAPLWGAFQRASGKSRPNGGPALLFSVGWSAGLEANWTETLVSPSLFMTTDTMWLVVSRLCSHTFPVRMGCSF